MGVRQVASTDSAVARARRRTRRGDIGLQRLLTDVGRIAGRPLADLCTLLNPDAVVLDGSVGPAGARIVHGLVETIERHASPAMSAAATVLVGSLGADADLHGAAALLRHEWENQGLVSSAGS
jgi:predicted NBD/HSP70 family sugar kinase